MKVSPVARTESLIVKEVDGETLVYDLTTDKAHCLNDTAARVWKNCDGRKTVSEISETLSADSNTAVKDEIVWLALDQLEKFKLLREAPARPGFLAGMTRRQMVARMGIAAIALPAIISIVTPMASAQGSLIPPTFCCVNPSDCITNNCTHVPVPCAVYPPNPQSSGKSCV
ncbi:MAG TPA: hypothetical protein DC047_19700 [Blastocatellia bacterium]|nr:hypothetical protein [Blastocatellia bacterium]